MLVPSHSHLRRLDRIWVKDAIYFITVCVKDRRSLLRSDDIVQVLREEWSAADERHGWLIGRFVVMPDHVHFFCAERPGEARRSLSRFIAQWKEWTSKRLVREQGMNSPIWQREFFDRVMRSDESYAEKWAYVRDNPVRAGFVMSWQEWRHQGSIHFDSPRPE